MFNHLSLFFFNQTFCKFVIILPSTSHHWNHLPGLFDLRVCREKGRNTLGQIKTSPFNSRKLNLELIYDWKLWWGCSEILQYLHSITWGSIQLHMERDSKSKVLCRLSFLPRFWESDLNQKKWKCYSVNDCKEKCVCSQIQPQQGQ